MFLGSSSVHGEEGMFREPRLLHKAPLPQCADEAEKWPGRQKVAQRNFMWVPCSNPFIPCLLGDLGSTLGPPIRALISDLCLDSVFGQRSL